jgi:hypothetical protein
MDPNAVPMLEALDGYGLLKLISPALTGEKLNAACLARFEKVAQAVLPAGSVGGGLAFLSVLIEKLNARERAEVLRAFEMTAAETAAWKKLEAQTKKLESALKSARIHKPSHVWEALAGASSDEVLMVLYQSQIRVVQDRIRAFYTKYLPQAQEITADEVAATGVKPGTPKFEKAYRAMVTARLNARPRKVVEPEAAEAPPEPPLAMAGGRGRGRT